VLLSIGLLVPGLALLPGRDAKPRQLWGQGWLERRLFTLVDWVERKPWWLGAATLLVTVLGVVGTLRLEVESDFTKNFRADSQLVESYVYVEENLGGAGVWDVMLPAEEALTWDYLKQVYRLERRLQQEVTVAGPDGEQVPALTKTLSLADAIVAGSPVNIDKMPLAILRNATARTGLATMRAKIPTFYQALYNQDPTNGQHYFRIMLRSQERQPSAVKKQIIGQVEQIVAEEFPDGEVTGFYVLLAGLIDSILRDQWLAFGVACVGVLLMMIAALRSLRLAVIALVPNALPILVVLGSFGWLQLLGFSEFKINMGAAMIAAVSMGLSIDSTIHYLTAYRRAKAAGGTTIEAIGEAQQGVGRAVVLSTAALVVGFLSMAMSNFIPTIYFGLLTSLTMLGGLAGNLLLLPLLLRVVGGRGKEPHAAQLENE
jgi:predicted RND superfamily exporter protein